MFKLRRPCVTCPFRQGLGKNFTLSLDRLLEIVQATAFQCHKTVDYDADEVEGEDYHGDHPQQCAGLMSLLHRANYANQIMQVGERLKGFFPDKLEHGEVYPDLVTAICDHTGQGREAVVKALSQLKPPCRVSG